jgi:putative peptide maturation dehydrogenase
VNGGRRVRRTAYFFIYCQDRDFLDLEALLRGEARPAPLRQIFALSILKGEECALNKVEIDVLFSTPSDQWIEVGEAGPDEIVDRLLDGGLLLSESEDGERAELRRRDEVLAGSEWNVYAALYHFMTKWRDVDVLEPEVEPDEASAAEEWLRRFGPPPSHFHSVDGGREPVRLPLPERTGGLYDALLARQTTRTFDSATPLDADDLAAILRYVYGAHGLLAVDPDVAVLRKTSPSGGALHPIEIYPLLLNVSGVQPGIYHYRVADHVLEPLTLMEREEAGDLAYEFSSGQAFTRDAQALFLLTARFYRSFWKYRKHRRAYAVLLMDAAHLSQTFYLVCAELGLGAFVTAAINGANIEERLGLDGFAEGALLLCGCGSPAPPGRLDPDFSEYVPGETVL